MTTERQKWTLGDKQPHPFTDSPHLPFDTKELRKSGGLYGLLISSVVPRPIALVTSKNREGIVNCAPFSYFNLLSHDPPVLSLGITHNSRNPAQPKKDTLRNIEESGRY